MYLIQTILMLTISEPAWVTVNIKNPEIKHVIYIDGKRVWSGKSVPIWRGKASITIISDNGQSVTENHIELDGLEGGLEYCIDAYLMQTWYCKMQIPFQNLY